MLSLFLARPSAPSLRSRLVSLVIAVVALAVIAPTVGAATAPWREIEDAYLAMLNCTRTGGRVLTDGTCEGYGSGQFSSYRKPLRRSGPISTKVSRPYARLIVEAAVCSHTYKSDIAHRLHEAGFHPTTYGENIGCASGGGTAMDLILRTHLMFQAEQGNSWDNAWHWRNMKKRAYKEVGIGVWQVDDRTYLVTDFVSG